MASLICGSMAFDTIMSFEGRFSEHILADQMHILNVSFLVPRMRREFGGCAGNIAYNLRLLQADPVIMATVGGDAGTYFGHLKRFDISTECIREIPEAFTAQAMITTDRDNNQITAFHPGAMSESHQNDVTQAVERRKSTDHPIRVGIVSPDGRTGMMVHAKQFVDNHVPFIFDPGQGLPMFDANELLTFIEQATYISVNDYEAEMLSQKIAMPLQEIARHVQAMIVTKGAQGSEIYTDGQRMTVPVVKVDHPVDPTGCGDAFRAGLLFGLENHLDLEQSSKLGSLMGAIKIASQGPQNHQPSYAAIQEQFRQAFGHHLI
jgi:adenosine kinase